MRRFLRFFCYINHKTIYIVTERAFTRRLMGLSAEIAFNVMLSLFPIILMVFTAFSLFTPSLENEVGQLIRYYQDVMPAAVWELLSDFAGDITQGRSKGLFSLSFVVTLWVSSGALSAAMNALDHIHNIPLSQRRPYWQAKLISLVITFGAVALLMLASFLVLVGDVIVRFALDLMIQLPVDRAGLYVLIILWRLLSFPLALSIGAGLVAILQHILVSPPDKRHPWRKFKRFIGVGAIAIAVLVFLAFLIIFVQYLLSDLQIDYDMAASVVRIWRFLSIPVALAIVSIAFAFIYSLGPSRWVKGTPVLPGAILAAIFWAGISSLFRLYVANFGQYNRVYGAVGTIIVLMLWLQLSALVMLIGDQLNAVVGEAMLSAEQEQLTKALLLEEET